MKLSTFSTIACVVFTLSGCANTMNGVAQDSVSAFNTAADFANKNRDALNTAATQTGEVLKKGANLIGKGMEATGELLQEMTAE